MASRRKKGRRPEDGEAGSPPQRSPGGLRAVVGIGASAGGVEALVELFAALPADLGAAYVVALHTEPASESHLREILGRQCRMPYTVVEERTVPESDHLYVALPGRMLTLREGALHVLTTEGRDLPSWPLDSLFLSLAEELGPRAVAVILSGTGSHGVAGAGHVRAESGLVIAQDPATAGHGSMPRHAVHAGVADLVLPPGEIAEALADYLDHDYVKEEPSEEEAAGRLLETALAILRARAHRDFRAYKRPTLLRRLRRRAGLSRCHDLEEYVARLREDEGELRALVDDLTVRVTGFFRDPEAWTELAERVLPGLVEERPSGAEIRLWAAGCATGEEAYSLAILVLERAERAQKSFDLKVFATDTAREALAVGRGGLYPEGAVEHLTRDRLKRFFRAENGGHRVTQALRDCVVFSLHDLLEAPPFSRMDLVSCRNLLIYLEPEAQERVIGLLHFALHEGGYLFLGKAESTGPRRELFEPVSKRWRVFRKVGPTRPHHVDFPLAVPGTRPGEELDDREPLPYRSRGRRGQRPDERLRDVLLERYAPASVLVDREFRILFFHGPTERYLRQPRGEPRQNLLAMAREDLRSAIRRAVRQAVETDAEPARVEARLESDDGPVRRVRVVATRVVQGDGGVEPVALVSFEEVGEAAPREARPERAEPGALDEVERELHLTREELRSTVEELEASNEELKASNEETTSMNEELQSTNEELETSKEELQSLNEELATVNAQLETKVEELEEVTNDLRNLLASTDIATLFLDTELRIRMFTPPAVRLFHLLPRDVGRPLADFRAQFADPNLMADAEAVLESLIPREAEVRSQDGRWYARRVLPYRAEDNRIEGVVATFSEVTALKRAQEELAGLNRELERRVEERTAHLRLLQDVAVIANAASSPERAIERTLERVCDFNGWVAGHVYRLGEAGVLEPGTVWYVRPDAGPIGDAIRQSLGESSLERGEGIPGQVLASGGARWSGGARTREDPRLAALRGAGIAAGVAFPVLVEDDVVAVLEFFSEHAIDLEDVTLEVMANVGTQLGRVVERARVEHRLADLALQEQQRLGEELHEGLGQQVTGLAVLARSLHQKLDDAGRPEAKLARQLVEHFRAARAQVQDLSKGLMPVRVHERGLEAALQEFVDEVCAAYQVHCRLEIDHVEVTDKRLATSLYRIAREAVNNAILHGRPSEIVVRIRREDHAIVLEVEDDGAGLPAGGPREGLGLKIMRDRASLVGGEVAIEPREGGGTRVRCVIREGGADGIG